MTKTFEEFKKRIRDAEKKPLPKGMTSFCICGKHTERIILTDAEIEHLWEIVKSPNGV